MCVSLVFSSKLAPLKVLNMLKNELKGTEIVKGDLINYCLHLHGVTNLV